MKITIFLIVILLCFMSDAFASATTMTGTELLGKCESAIKVENHGEVEFFNSGQCIGYVNGVADISYYYNKICIPDGVNQGQSVRVVVKYLEDHPEQLHLNGFQLTLKALIGAFPCK